MRRENGMKRTGWLARARRHHRGALRRPWLTSVPRQAPSDRMPGRNRYHEMRRHAWILASLLTLGGTPCAATSAEAPELQGVTIRIDGPAGLTDTTTIPDVDLSGGIDADEASRIASHLFSDYAGIGCGVVEKVGEDAESWLFETRIGYGGSPGANMRVAKTDGAVTWFEPTLLEHAAVLVASGIRFVGPRPRTLASEAFPDEVSARLATLQEEIILLLSVEMDAEGIPRKIGAASVAAGDRQLGEALAAQLSQQLLEWRFYPQGSGETITVKPATFLISGGAAAEP